MSKHTPGPWYWNSDDGLWSKKNGEVLVASDDSRPYGMHSAMIEHHYDPEIKKANKTLIAAAPELFEALEDIAGTHHHSASAGEYFAKVARAAIAKALGENNE